MFEGGELPHRPIPYLTFAANYQLGRLLQSYFGTAPLDPLPFHAVNIAIHLLNGWLLYQVVSRLLTYRRPAAAASLPPPIIAAAAAAL